MRLPARLRLLLRVSGRPVLVVERRADAEVSPEADLCVSAIANWRSTVAACLKCLSLGLSRGGLSEA